MAANENAIKSQIEKKHELASAWSFHLFQALDDKLEKALNTDTSST